MEAGVTTEAAAEAASFSSILDKPLSQLTEEDISQLTREDCRKFLKQKGMRRPSWNKSQAIQQVILLKALLESNDDSGAVSPPPLSPPPQNAVVRVASNSGDSVKDGVSGEEERFRPKDPILETALVGEMNCRGSDTDKKNLSPRSPYGTTKLGEQMTVLYCGKVNVYDGVPVDKAQTIMHLAVTPIDFPQDNLCCGNAALTSFRCNVQAAGDKNEKMTEYEQQFRDKANINRDSDGQVNRKVKLQRYLEKRKDRKNAGQTPSGLEIYLNHRMTTHTNGQSCQSSRSSPPESELPRAFCSLADNQAKLVNLSADLNYGSGQEH